MIPLGMLSHSWFLYVLPCFADILWHYGNAHLEMPANTTPTSLSRLQKLGWNT